MDLIIGIVTSLGGLVFVLYKFNLITFGKESFVPKKETLPNHTVCEGHKELVSTLRKVSNQQILHGSLHKQHFATCQEGKEDSKEINIALKLIGQSVAVLLDRSNRAEGVKKNEVQI